MFNYINGKLVEVTPAYAVIDCGGVGYLLEISLTTYTQIKDMSEVKLLTHFVVREDAQMLFGFYEEKERTLFRNLVNVNGVGVATARVMLSSFATDELAQAIISQDVKAVQSIKGIGAKTAQRIVLELHDKLGKMDELNLSPVRGGTRGNKNQEEALSALLALGFPKSAAEKAVHKIAESEPDATVENIIKMALKML
ncbi:MAG: Holliday junction branch migration protein RuvA [Bacteroidales bacterium]|nr:Holliday junction branch migration protein RuvA [Bacteroidales bacterium]